MSCTVDASVFVAASRPSDVNHAASRQFLRRVRAAGERVVCPTLLLSECAGAVVRPTEDVELAAEAVTMLARFPGAEFVPLDLPRGHRAAEIAIVHRLKGADAVYVALAEEAGATLVTWDVETLQRGPTTLTRVTPPDWHPRPQP